MRYSSKREKWGTDGMAECGARHAISMSCMHACARTCIQPLTKWNHEAGAQRSHARSHAQCAFHQLACTGIHREGVVVSRSKSSRRSSHAHVKWPKHMWKLLGKLTCTCEGWVRLTPGEEQGVPPPVEIGLIIAVILYLIT